MHQSKGFLPAYHTIPHQAAKYHKDKDKDPDMTNSIPDCLAEQTLPKVTVSMEHRRTQMRLLKII